MSEHVYDELAGVYAEASATSPANALYDRPTILDLVGDLDGRDVLELGCGAGHLTRALVARGARVTSYDRSPQMVAHARGLVGDDAHIEVADLADPFELTDASVDVVTASLVLHYLSDWRGVIGEVGRVLRPGGVFVMSVHHPITAWNYSDRSDYHRTELVSETWNLNGVRTEVETWRRPIGEIFAPLLEQELAIDAVVEPRPSLTADQVPEEQVRDALNHTPVFLFVRARRGAVARRG